jgi:hypothetical protein
MRLPHLNIQRIFFIQLFLASQVKRWVAAFRVSSRWLPLHPRHARHARSRFDLNPLALWPH